MSWFCITTINLKCFIRVGCVLACLFMAGCSEVELYSDLSESQANDMLAVLVADGVGANKINQGKGVFSISVVSSDTLRALALLKDAGLPRGTRDSIGTVFQKSGIISSPFEERVRYIYALGEDVADTLNQIDGVVTARVHVVLPESGQPGQAIKPSSAAVFIRHQAGVDLDFFVPQIRRLVSSAIEGLEYSAVTVVLMEAIPTKAKAKIVNNEDTVSILGMSINKSNASLVWTLLSVIASIFVLLLAVGLFWFYKNWSNKKKQRGGGVSEDIQSSPQVESR